MSDVTTFDLADGTVRDLNQTLHEATAGVFRVTNPRGAHAVAAGGHECSLAFEGDFHCGWDLSVFG